MALVNTSARSNILLILSVLPGAALYLFDISRKGGKVLEPLKESNIHAGQRESASRFLLPPKPTLDSFSGRVALQRIRCSANESRNSSHQPPERDATRRNRVWPSTFTVLRSRVSLEADTPRF